MSNANTALGPDAEVYINNVAFAVIEGRYTDMANVVETTDSLSNYAKEAAPGNHQFTMDVTMQRINSFSAIPLPGGNNGSRAMVNYYNSPLYVFPSSYVKLQLFLDGALFSTGTYTINAFLIEELEGNFRVQGSEVQTVRIRGRSSGEYITPDGTTVGGSGYERATNL